MIKDCRMHFFPDGDFEELQPIKQEINESDSEDIPHVKDESAESLNDLVNPPSGMNTIILPTEVAQKAFSISESCPKKVSNSKHKPVKQKAFSISEMNSDKLPASEPKPAKQVKTSDITKSVPAFREENTTEQDRVMSQREKVENSKPNPVKQGETNDATKSMVDCMDENTMEQCRVTEERDKVSNSKPNPVKQGEMSDIIDSVRAFMEETTTEQHRVPEERESVTLSELYPNILSTLALNQTKKHKSNNVVMSEHAGEGVHRIEQDVVLECNYNDPRVAMCDSVCIVPQIPSIASCSSVTQGETAIYQDASLEHVQYKTNSGENLGENVRGISVKQLLKEKIERRRNTGKLETHNSEHMIDESDSVCIVPQMPSISSCSSVAQGEAACQDIVEDSSLEHVQSRRNSGGNSRGISEWNSKGIPIEKIQG